MPYLKIKIKSFLINLLETRHQLISPTMTGKSWGCLLLLLITFTLLSSIVFGISNGYWLLYGHTAYHRSFAEVPALQSLDPYIKTLQYNMTPILNWFEERSVAIFRSPNLFVFASVLMRALLLAAMVFVGWAAGLSRKGITLALCIAPFICQPDWLASVNLSMMISYHNGIISALTLLLALGLLFKRRLMIAGLLSGFSLHLHSLYGISFIIFALGYLAITHWIQGIPQGVPPDAPEREGSHPAKYLKNTFHFLLGVTLPFIFFAYQQLKSPAFSAITPPLLTYEEWLKYLLLRDPDDAFFSFTYGVPKILALVSLFVWWLAFRPLKALNAIERWCLTYFSLTLVFLGLETLIFTGLWKGRLAEIYVGIEIQRTHWIFLLGLMLCFSEVFANLFAQDSSNNRYKKELGYFSGALLLIAIMRTAVIPALFYLVLILSFFEIVRKRDSKYGLLGLSLAVIIGQHFWVSDEVIVFPSLPTWGILENLKVELVNVIFLIPIAGLLLLKFERIRTRLVFITALLTIILCPSFLTGMRPGSWGPRIYTNLAALGHPPAWIAWVGRNMGWKFTETHEVLEASGEVDDFDVYIAYLGGVSSLRDREFPDSAFKSYADAKDFIQGLDEVAQHELSPGLLLLDPTIRLDARMRLPLPLFTYENLDRSLSAFSRIYASDYDLRLKLIFGKGLNWFYQDGKFHERIREAFAGLTSKKLSELSESGVLRYVFTRTPFEEFRLVFRNRHWYFYDLTSRKDEGFNLDFK